MNPHRKQPAAGPPPPWWHSWVNSLLLGRGAEISKSIQPYLKKFIPSPGALLWLVGLMMQVFCLWILHELVMVIMKMVTVGAELAGKFLDQAS
jgi:hypothetical protein